MSISRQGGRGVLERASARAGHREWHRRDFLKAAGVGIGALAWLPRARADEGYALSSLARSALESSNLVYVSPLTADGAESRCHGEVWYFFDQGDVVLATASDTWKSRALKRGRERARIWVGNFGRAKSPDGPFRQGPNFEARARFDTDPAAFERLLTAFGKKYPDEWGKWEPRFREGYADGSRIVIRYTPIGR